MISNVKLLLLLTKTKGVPPVIEFMEMETSTITEESSKGKNVTRLSESEGMFIFQSIIW